MHTSFRFYDRALHRLTRRELLNIAWTLGVAAVVPARMSAAAMFQPTFRTYPFALGVASGDPLPDGVVLWTRLALSPSTAAACPRRISRSDGKSPVMGRSEPSSARASRWRDPSSGTVCTWK